MNTIRRTLAISCLLAGLVLGAVSLLVAYAARSVLDPDAFASRATASLEDPRVAQFVAGQIVDAALVERPDLTAVRPVLVTIAREVVSSEPFRALLRPAARRAHGLITAETTEQLVLSLPDVAVLLRSALANVSPDVAERLPDHLPTAVATLPETPAVNGILGSLRFARSAQRFAGEALIVSAFLLAMATAIVRPLRDGVMRTGAAVAAGALTLGALVPIGRLLVRSTVDEPVLRGAVAGVWDAFAGGLWTWAGAIAALGFLVHAAALSTDEVPEIERLGARLWGLVTRARPHPLHEAARLLVLSGVGLFAVLNPATLGRALVVAIGAALLYAALHGIVQWALPPRPTADLVARPRPLRPALRFAVLVVAVLAAGSVVVYRLQVSGARGPADATDECNGSVDLCDRPLNEVTFAGTHNAMGSTDEPGWLFPNQDLGIPAQLRLGVRALLIDVHYGRAFGNRVKTDLEGSVSAARFEGALGQEGFEAAMRIRDRLTGEGGPRGLYLCHALCELGATPFVTVLRNIRDFVVTNPSEVLVLILEDYVAPDEVAAAFVESGLDRYVYRGVLGSPWSSLGALVERGGRVLVFGEHETGDVPWYHPAFEAMQETPYTFHEPAEFSCVANRGPQDASLFLVNHWIETTPAPRPSNAAVVNTRDFIEQRARECARERRLTPNVIAVDFVGIGDLVGAVAVLNGVAGEESEAAPGR